MSVRALRLHDRVELLAAGALAEDSHGNDVADWGNADVKVEPALVVPVTSSENLAAQDTVTTRWRIFLLAMSVADPRGRVRWRGDVYEVDGDVELYSDNRGRPHHREALLLRTSGS